MRTKILVTAVGPPDVQARLEALGPGFQVEFRPSEDRVEIDALEDPDLEVLIGSFPPRDLTRTPRLRWLQLPSAGADHILADAPWDRGLIVTNAKGIFAPAIGQYVAGAILRINEHVDERLALQLQHAWPRGELHDHVTGRLVRGQTLLIVGYGGLGREVARLADALGMRVIAVKREPEVLVDRSYRAPHTGDPNGSIPELVAAPSELEAFVPLADVVVLTLPLTDRTRGLFDERLIASMRPDAWLINCGRGAILNEVVLTRSLLDRRIGGAVLDVFETEPLPADSPLWDAPNTIVSPHVSGGDASSGPILAELYVENLARYARGQPLLNIVTGERQY